jgi:hypothetical protein
MEPNYDPSLLPGVREIRETWTGPGLESMGLWGYNNFKGSMELAYSYASLFWPDFVEIDGALMLAEHYSDENFAHWNHHLNGDLTRIESMMNLVKIDMLFMNHSPDNELENIVWDTVLAVLKSTWTACVRARFPDQDIVVSEFDPEDGSTPQLTIHRNRVET